MELNEIRAELDRVDAELLRLFAERMALAGEVAAYKAPRGLPVYCEAREREILGRVRAESGALAPYAERLFAELLALSRAYQETLIKR